jgi:hypothetical protein
VTVLLAARVLPLFAVPTVKSVLAAKTKKTTRTILSVDVQNQECRNLRLARINGIPRPRAGTLQVGLSCEIFIPSLLFWQSLSSWVAATAAAANTQVSGAAN